jgi:predicted metal-dependent hydrolase
MNAYTIILVILIILLCIKIYSESDYANLKCIISNLDGNTYCVRERNKLELAADKLAKVSTNLKKLVEYCEIQYPDQENVKKLVKKFNPKQIVETLPTSKYTAYSENKGEKLAFCLNTEKNNNKLIDLNTLMYVALHEISHIASKSIGHTDEFWQNFKFFIEQANTINIYKPIDYKKTPAKYCGMDITDNPYFDIE